MQTEEIIGLKLGSSALVEDGRLRYNFISSVCLQVAELINAGQKVFIVTSGAVASDPKQYRSKNLRSAVGQVRLINEYCLALEEMGIETAQFLLTDKELVDIGSKRNTLVKKTMLEAMKDRVVPIINANDVIDNEEIGALNICADNDKLFKLVCCLVGADVAVIGTDQGGFLDSKKTVIKTINAFQLEEVIHFAKGGSTLGHGNDGMRVKITILVELAKRGIWAHLAPIHENNFLLRAANREKDFGTIVVF